MNELILGTRGSALARAQSQWVAGEIEKKTGVAVQLKIIRTKGDQIIDKPLSAIGGKGLFTAELEQALLNGTIHFAVHSLKDLPTEESKGLCIASIPKREDVRDAVVGKSLLQSQIVGTGSLRRQAQIKRLFSNVQMKGIRGNIDTRILKMDKGEYDSVVLAMAGLNRLGIQREDIYPLEIEDCIPAAGQGALALQCACDRADIIAILKEIHCEHTDREITTERTFLEVYGGGCHVAAGCVAFSKDGEITALAMAEDSTGRVHRASIQGEDPVILGRNLAQQLLEASSNIPS